MSKKTIKKSSKPKPMQNKFTGADDIYLTPKKIAVRRIKSGKNNLIDTTTYYTKNADNVRAAQSIVGHLRKGR